MSGSDNSDLGDLNEVILSGVRDLIASGRVHFELGNIKLAGRQFELAVQIAPNSAEALLRRGAALHDLGDYPRAFWHYKRASQEDPECGLPHLNIGVLLMHGKDIPRALDHLDQAVALAPDFPPNYLWRGIAHRCRYKAFPELRRRDSQLCEEFLDIEDFTRALELAPDYRDALLERSASYRITGRNREAIGDFDHAIRLKPDYWAAHREMAKARFSMDDTEGSIEGSVNLSESGSRFLGV